MLVRLTDHKGRERWVNPIYIKSVFEKKPGEVEIEVSGWAMKLKATMPVDELVLQINAAMPDVQTSFAAVEEEAEQQRRQAAASAAAG